MSDASGAVPAQATPVAAAAAGPPVPDPSPPVGVAPSPTPPIPPQPPEPAAAADTASRLRALGFSDIEDLLTVLEMEHERMTTQQAAPQPTTPAPTTTTPGPTIAQVPAAAAPAVPVPAATQVAPVAAPPVAAPPVGTDDPVNDRRIPDATRRRLNKLRDDMRARTEAAESAVTQHQQQVTTLQAQIKAHQEGEKLKIAMVRAGVQEVDFAWHLLSTELAAMRDSQDPAMKEALAKFDITAWCANLKTQRAYLFGQAPVPATSPAAAHAPAPAAQTPAAVAGATAAAGAVDMRKATPEQMKQRMAELGIPYNRRGRPG